MSVLKSNILSNAQPDVDNGPVVSELESNLLLFACMGLRESLLDSTDISQMDLRPTANWVSREITKSISRHIDCGANILNAMVDGWIDVIQKKVRYRTL